MHPQDYIGPHDYYGPENYPIQRAMGHPADYIEPDLFAGHADAALPIISTVGAGPRGHGIRCEVWTNQEFGQWGIDIYDDETEELIVHSPALNSPRITVTQDKHNLVAGEPSIAHIHYRNSGADNIEDVVLNPGADGTRLYFNANLIQDFDPANVIGHTQTCHYTDLDKKEYHSNHHTRPEARVDDVVCGFARGKEAMYFYVGIVEWSNLDHDPNYAYDVVYVIHAIYDWILPVIGSNGHWFIEGKDSGVSATGPQGPKGDKGDTPVITVSGGRWYVDGRDTGVSATGERGPEGHTPYIGSNGTWWINGRDLKVTAKGDKGDKGEKGDKPEITVDPETGHWIVDGKDTGYCSRGEDGFAFDLQYNYYVLGKDTLPDYDSVPYGFAFVVHDVDPELERNRFDLYYKGRVPVASEDGGPWVVVEDWQGQSGTSFHVMEQSYTIGSNPEGIITIPRENAGDIFSPAPPISGDIVMDSKGYFGQVSENEDGNFVITPLGWSITLDYKLLSNAPGQFRYYSDPDNLLDEERLLTEEELSSLSYPEGALVPGCVYVDSEGNIARLESSEDPSKPWKLVPAGGIHSTYADLPDKPSINGVTIEGDMNFSEFNASYDDLSNKPTINGKEITGEITTEDLQLDYGSLLNKPALNGVELTPDSLFKDISPDYDDLINKPTINGVELNNETNDTDLNLNYDNLQNLPTINGHEVKGDLTNEDLDLAATGGGKYGAVYYFDVDETGDLYLYYDDSLEEPPPFEYDDISGELYVLLGDEE